MDWKILSIALGVAVFAETLALLWLFDDRRYLKRKLEFFWEKERKAARWNYGTL